MSGNDETPRQNWPSESPEAKYGPQLPAPQTHVCLTQNIGVTKNKTTKLIPLIVDAIGIAFKIQMRQKQTFWKLDKNPK